MQYYSLNNKKHKVSFKEAVIKGLAPDKGLYFPSEITPLNSDFFENIEKLNNKEIAFEVIKQFIGKEIPEKKLKQIIEKTLSFDFPLVEIEENIFSLELFHGPTMAFKDVGARFMSRCLGYFNQNTKEKEIVLVATSGDTGGAVANGFLNEEGVEVIILYPSGKVSDIQERQLTTLGKNITALKVEGVFDDCQEMVKKAFLDEDLKSKNLTSANSINIARWLPQMFYFFFSYARLKRHKKPIIVSCPSGNFGNICAGVLAKKLGLPITQFVASTNANDTIPKYLRTGEYQPNPSIATISNAMDVGNPSNFIRIQELFNHDLKELKKEFQSYSFTDEETKKALKKLYQTSSYISEPHGAIGYLGLKKIIQDYPNSIGVFLETAHPIKFKEIVEQELKTIIPVPDQIKDVLNKEKNYINIKNYDELKSILLNK